MRVSFACLRAVLSSTVLALSRSEDPPVYVGPTTLGTALGIIITVTPTTYALASASSATDVSWQDNNSPAPIPIDNCCTDADGKTIACVIYTCKSSKPLVKDDLPTTLLVSSIHEDKKKHTTTAPKLTGSPLPIVPPKSARGDNPPRVLPGPVYPQGCCCLTDNGTPTMCAMAECQKSSVSYVCKHDVAQGAPATEFESTASTSLHAPITFVTQSIHEDKKKH